MHNWQTWREVITEPGGAETDHSANPMRPDGDGCGNKRLVVLLDAWDECVMYHQCETAQRGKIGQG